MLAEGLHGIHQLRIIDLSPSPSDTNSSALAVLPIDTGAFEGSNMDYKSAKEAFVADNPGTSIWTVNAVSLVGLVSSAACLLPHLYCPL
jgi:hypothetical protein